MSNTLLMLASPKPLVDAARAVLADVAPDWSVRVALTVAEALPIAPEARAIFTFPPFFADAIVQTARRVEWVQSMGTGVDGIAGRAGLPPGVIVSATREVHGPVMSEMGMLLMLALARGLPRYFRQQAARHWEQFPATLLEGKTVGIVGMGDIATHLARKCKAFDMRVVGITRTPREAAHFDEVVARDTLAACVGRFDFLVVLAPPEPNAPPLIDARVLAAMKPSAFFVNIARGKIVDEAALIQALAERRIAGAGLDVFATEPLPAASPLWTLENVLLTPHIGGFFDGYVAKATPLWRHNLAMFAQGRPEAMRHRV